MGVREWVEKKVDNLKEKYVREPTERSEQRAISRYMRREREIEREEDIDPQTGRRRGISEELANKWRARSSKRYERESVPRRVRYFDAFVGGVKSDWSSAKGNVRRATSPKSITRYRKDYSRSASSALRGSGPGSHRSTHQFGSFLLTGSATKQSKASGWGILYGTRYKGSRGERGSGGRRKKKDEGGSGFGFL